MRSSEWIAFIYFVYLALVCWLRPLASSRRLLVTAVSLALSGAIVIFAVGAPSFVRDWLPFLYVSAGYYLTGFLYVGPSEALESWLLAWDRRLMGDPTTRFARWPGWIVAYLDVVYMFCFLLLPGGFAILVATGHSMLANHYWTMVLAADFGAFAPLSVFQTRPPWALEQAPALADRSVHRLAHGAKPHDRRQYVSQWPRRRFTGRRWQSSNRCRQAPLAGAHREHQHCVRRRTLPGGRCSGRRPPAGAVWAAVWLVSERSRSDTGQGRLRVTIDLGLASVTSRTAKGY